MPKNQLRDSISNASAYEGAQAQHDSISESQVGGDHYKKYKISPLVFFHENKIPPVEANITKYVLRHKDKNGAEDLQKALHLINFLLEHDYGI